MTPSTTASDLWEKLSSHMLNMGHKFEIVNQTGTPIPQKEFERDVAISIELYQQYIDLLDNIKERIETSSDNFDLSGFSEFSKRFDVMYSKLTPEQEEYFTRKETAS